MLMILLANVKIISINFKECDYSCLRCIETSVKCLGCNPNNKRIFN